MSQQPVKKNTAQLMVILGLVVVALGAILINRYVDAKKSTAPRPRTASLRRPAEPRPVRNRLAGKIRREGDRQFLWAKGSTDPSDESSEWFDLTGSPLPLEGFQYGIGKDTIASIDHPVFVTPDDPRLQAKWPTMNLDNLPVLGFSHNGVDRAYPVALLDRHELVNDTIGGKPVTVGW